VLLVEFPFRELFEPLFNVLSFEQISHGRISMRELSGEVAF
jgi:hypothetical protein